MIEDVNKIVEDLKKVDEGKKFSFTIDKGHDESIYGKKEKK